MDLSAERKKIDEIDRKLVNLIEERMDLCLEIGRIKAANNAPVLDTSREQEKLDKIKSMTVNEEYKEATNNIFVKVMEESRKLQSKIDR